MHFGIGPIRINLGNLPVKAEVHKGDWVDFERDVEVFPINQAWGVSFGKYFIGFLSLGRITRTY